MESAPCVFDSTHATCNWTPPSITRMPDPSASKALDLGIAQVRPVVKEVEVHSPRHSSRVRKSTSNHLTVAWSPFQSWYKVQSRFQQESTRTGSDDSIVV